MCPLGYFSQKNPNFLYYRYLRKLQNMDPISIFFSTIKHWNFEIFFHHRVSHKILLGFMIVFVFFFIFSKVIAKKLHFSQRFCPKQPKTGTIDFQKNNYVIKYQYFLKSDHTKFHLTFKKTYNKNQVKSMLETSEIHSGKNHVLGNAYWHKHRDFTAIILGKTIQKGSHRYGSLEFLALTLCTLIFCTFTLCTLSLWKLTKCTQIRARRLQYHLKDVKTSQSTISIWHFSPFHNVLTYTEKRPTSSHEKAHDSAEIL